VNLQRLTSFAAIALMATSAWSQSQTPTQPAAPPTVIKTETKLVLVDVVATSKKGQYIDDLTQKNFRVWEDNKEQQIKTFSYGPDPSSPDAGKRYLILYFDSNTLTATELGQARIAAQHFIESNAGPDRLMLVAMHMGATQILQNFTPDIDKLKASLTRVQAGGIIRGPDMAVMGGINRGGMDDQMMGGPRISRIVPCCRECARSPRIWARFPDARA
jgi:VWFA-related protein